MTALRVDVSHDPQLHILTDIKKVPAVSQVKSPPSFFAVGRNDDTRLAFAFRRKHTEKESGRQRDIVELHIKRACNDLIIWNCFCFGGDDLEVRMLKVTRSVAVVDTENLVIFSF